MSKAKFKSKFKSGAKFKPLTICEEANVLTQRGGDRRSSYGHPLHDFSKTAELWSAILDVKVTADQVGLCMIALKLRRQLNMPKRDNLVDIAGYAQTLSMIDEARASGEILCLK